MEGPTPALTKISMRYLTSNSYDVIFRHTLLDPADDTLASVIADRRGLVVTTPSVASVYGEAVHRYVRAFDLNISVHVFPLTERTKTLGSVAAVAEAAVEAGLGRRDLLVAFGGGVCCDVVSYAAASIRRGIPHAFVPTTLVGQVDAAVGLKGGVNFQGRKNYLGCFEAPEVVLVDPGFLSTLGVRDVRSGLAEMLKMALIRDEDLFETLVRWGPEFIGSRLQRPGAPVAAAMHRAVELMLAELEPNPYEDRSLKRLVDFGHTFSGAMEERSRHELKHGEAVAIDMAVSSLLAAELGLLPERDLMQILRAYERMRLPATSRWSSIAALEEGIEDSVRHRGGSLNLVLPIGIGSAAFVEDRGAVSERALRKALARSRTLSNRASMAGR